MKSAVGLVVCIVVVAAAASFGGLFGTGEWYDTIAKPDWNPPNWVFGPVWTTLYTLMAISAWLVWLKREERHVGIALTMFGIQLTLNALWTPLFFGLHWLGVATFEIVLLWVAILLTILLFWRVSKPAAAMLVPYLAWVAFASFLCFTIWRLNA